MSWVAVGTAAVSVVGGVVQANNSKKGAPPAVPYQNVDPQAEQKKAVAGNIANQGDIEQMLTRTNKYTQGQANDLMEQAVPGYGELSKSLMGRAKSLADNPYDVPPEVEANLTRLAAEHGVSRGTRGQTNQFSLLRDLGVNQLQYGQQNLRDSLGALTSLTGMAPRVSPASPLSFFLTPAQAISATTNNNTQNQAISQGAVNAQTSVNNYNREMMWDAIMKGVGTATSLAGGMDWSGGGKADITGKDSLF